MGSQLVDLELGKMLVGVLRCGGVGTQFACVIVLTALVQVAFVEAVLF